jgi:DNA-binding transcriptional LysR family regulator
MNSVSAIERGSLDCAVGTFPFLPHDAHVQPLLRDRYVCVMRKAHGLSIKISFESFLGASHVLVTPTEQGLGHVESWLRLHGRTRDIALTVNSFADALRIVAQSDLLTCVPMIVFKTHEKSVVAKERLVFHELPFDTGEMLYKLIWHERTHSSSAHMWFRALIADVCARGL